MKTMNVEGWCERHGFSRGFYYILKKQGRAPRAFKVGAKTLITEESDTEWVRAREAETAAATDRGADEGAAR